MRWNTLLKTSLAAALCATALPAAAQTVVANDVAINGESFFGLSNIRDELNRLARTAGVIGPNESFRQIAVSGAVMTQILGYYVNATPKPKYVITDGGGNDLMQACPAPASPDCPKVQATVATVRAYFDSMRVHGTEKVLWMRYPDPYGANWATLKTNQDLYNPLVKEICDTVKAPKCVWIDLRPVWEGHYPEYTNDGIHPTAAGGTATAEAFWKVIVDSAFFGAPTALERPVAAFSAAFATGGARLHVRVADEGPHRVRVRDASGRELFARRGFGPAEYRFEEIARAGVYVVRVEAGNRVFARAVAVTR